MRRIKDKLFSLLYSTSQAVSTRHTIPTPFHHQLFALMGLVPCLFAISKIYNVPLKMEHFLLPTVQQSSIPSSSVQTHLPQISLLRLIPPAL